MKVHFIIPWDSEKNIGKAYNEAMKMVDENDWVCFIDGDVINTTTFFGQKIEEIIKSNPDYSVFTCYTNRVNRKYQIYNLDDWENNDMDYHRKIGENIWNKNGTSVIDITKKKPLSGVMILISKKVWTKIGGFFEDKMFGIDNILHKKVKECGYKIGLMTGIYVYHWYRNGDKKNKFHLE
jgi:GT2 family glycosyltransferase